MLEINGCIIFKKLRSENIIYKCTIAVYMLIFVIKMEKEKRKSSSLYLVWYLLVFHVSVSIYRDCSCFWFTICVSKQS